MISKTNKVPNDAQRAQPLGERIVDCATGLSLIIIGLTFHLVEMRLTPAPQSDPVIVIPADPPERSTSPSTGMRRGLRSKRSNEATLIIDLQRVTAEPRAVTL